MRILIHSNGPKTPSGYGVQTGLLAPRLRDAGHDVCISVYWGWQTGIGSFDGIPMVPCSGEAYGNDILHEHALHWFDNDPLGGWIIPIMDVFGLSSPVLHEFNVAPWTPVDHHPCPPPVTEFFARTGAEPIAMSRFGERLLRDEGFDPMYAPLVVDTSVFRPIEDARRQLEVDDAEFVVLMNGMNKGPYHHRKGYPEAFFAFAQFAKNHTDAVLMIHSEMHGMHHGGIDLVGLAAACGVAEHQLRFCDQYAYRCGFITPENLAVTYSAADVLLAPSRGEGFCIPLIESQACGTSVIVTDFSAQPELVGSGWKVPGQPEWEAALRSWYIKADIPAIVQKLEESYEQRGDETNRQAAIGKAREYDADLCFERYWLPILEELEGADRPALNRTKMRNKDAVAVLVPCLNRPQNVMPLVESFMETTTGNARLYFVCDEDDTEQIRAVKDAGCTVLLSTRGSTYAQKVNSGFEQTTEPWLFVTGDDVRFRKGWLASARKLSDRFDVIGTNDTATPGGGNPKVANGSHADHFFIRRSYVEEHGGSLDGLICHEGYKHFYADVEVVELAKARRVFAPCLDSLVEHLHPGMGKAEIDDTYLLGWSQREADEAEWRKRAPVVAMQRVGRGKVRTA